MNRNRFLRAGACLLAFSSLFFLTGCSSSSKSSTATTTLYWWRPSGDVHKETLDEIVKNYQTAGSNVKIEVVQIDPRNYEQEVLAALAANKTVQNAPDIISVPAEDLPRYQPQLAPAPSTLFDQNVKKADKTGKDSVAYVKSLFVDGVQKPIILKDQPGAPQVYGLPLAMDNLALYINNTLVQKAIDTLKSENKVTQKYSDQELKDLSKKIETPPTTWKELVDIIPFLTVKSGSEITQAGIAMGTSKNVVRSYDILSAIMMQNGTKLVSSDQNSATFNQTQSGAASTKTPGEEALKFYLGFSDPSSSYYSWNDKMSDSLTAFEQGQVAMMINYADAYRYIINQAPSMKNQITAAALPQVVDPKSPTATDQLKTMANFSVEAVTSAKGDAAKQAAAWGFVYYATSKAGAGTYLSATQLLSPLKDGQDKVKLPAFSDQKKYSDVWYKGHKASEVDTIFISMINDAYTKAKSAKSALDSAAANVSTILQACKVKWADTTTTATQ